MGVNRFLFLMNYFCKPESLRLFTVELVDLNKDFRLKIKRFGYQIKIIYYGRGGSPTMVI